MLDRLSKAFRRYLNINRLINTKTDLKTVLKTVLWALFSSAVLVLIPVLFLINMFIFTKLTFFISVGLLLMLLIWVYLYFMIYYKLLLIYVPELEKVNTRPARFFEMIVTQLLFLSVGIAVLIALF
ncbi:MAG: hypothetical protein K9K93_03185 [Acholeplasmataceae bacterium]|nr:hypothetical protein [Acholeplasmataceae bacterium]